jgi:hypothetical protein
MVRKRDTSFPDGSRSNNKRDPEKWIPLFRADHAQTTSVIRKSGYRFSEKITRKQQA